MSFFTSYYQFTIPYNQQIRDVFKSKLLNKINLMKYILCFFFLSILLSSEIRCQDISSPWSIGVSVIKSEYRGDLGYNLFDWKNSQYFGAGLQIRNYVNSTFDVGVDLSISDHGYWEGSNNNFLSKQYQSSLQIIYKFNNGYILNEQSAFAPYLLAGAGYTFYKSDPSRGSNDMLLNIPLAFGFKVKLGRRVSLFMQSTYNLTNSDKSDMMSGDINTNNLVNGNDHFLNHHMGFVINIGKNERKMDFDKDGITNFYDDCPNVSGVEAMQGCPDTDFDGIKDSEDPCPNQSGSLLMGGCPDTDKDGIADHEDECPVNAGSIALRGCPDSDNDGVTDAFDPCPNFPGSLANKGCPKIEPQTRALLKKAKTEVSFEMESSRFQESSIPILQEILNVMMEHSYYELIIESHYFDEAKEDKFELNLSQNRADVIKQFLVTNGIDEDRLIPVGYGSYKPHAISMAELEDNMLETLEFKINF